MMARGYSIVEMRVLVGCRYPFIVVALNQTEAGLHLCMYRPQLYQLIQHIFKSADSTATSNKSVLGVLIVPSRLIVTIVSSIIFVREIDLKRSI